MDIRYRNSAAVVSDSVALASSPFPLDSKALRSESNIFATRARGSCGVDPGPIGLRIVTMSVSLMDELLYGVRKRLMLVQSMMFSIFAVQFFITLMV